ncbi:unnamed protein product [Effrenium voratum]|nr:unnamed protein product [Effrenium voratum]
MGSSHSQGSACSWHCNGEVAGRHEGEGEEPVKRVNDAIAKSTSGYLKAPDSLQVSRVWKTKDLAGQECSRESGQSPSIHTSIAGAAPLSQVLQRSNSSHTISEGLEARTDNSSDDQTMKHTMSVYSDASNASTRSSHRHHCQRLKLVETMGHVPSAALQLVINNPCALDSVYLVEKPIGKGAFGIVRFARVRATGAKRAIKTISKEMMKENTAALKLEIEIMKMLDHPCIVMLFEVFEDEDVHLSMELCSGGCLTDRVKAASKNHLPHDELPAVMRQILSAVFYLHEKNIIHRDLKSDNILTKVGASEPLGRTSLKVSDFGLSRIVEDGEYLSSSAGTPSHMAPEVYEKRANHKVDIWSCGVMLYYLACGDLPFKNENETCRARYRMTTSAWASADPNLGTFLSLLLCKRPSLRYSARRALRDDYLHRPKSCVRRKGLLEDMREFRSHNKFKRSVICTAVYMLPESQIAELRELFISLDIDGDGVISSADLKRAGSLAIGMDDNPVGSQQVRAVCRVADKYDSFSSKPFSFTEFVAAAIDPEAYLNTKVLRATFNCFDRDGDGSISLSELSNGRLLGALSLEELHEIMTWCDEDGNMQIEFKEFEDMMRRDPA